MNETSKSLQEQLSATTDLPAQSGANKAERQRKVWKWLLSLAVLLVVVLAVTNGVRKSRADNAADVEPTIIPTIDTSTAYNGPIGFYIQALGTVTPLATVNLYSQVNGRVMAVHYREGQMVQRGDALIDLDPRPYQAQLVEAQGTLQHDQGLLAQAEMDLSRYKEASDLQAIARQTYEDQKQVVEQYKGTVRNDTGQIEYAQVQLSYCHLTSPITGRVGLRLVDPGNTIFSGSSNSIVVITQLSPISVVFNVAEDDLGQVHGVLLHRAGLLVDAYDRSQRVKLASGHLLTIDNQIDNSTGTVRFRGQFDNKDLALFPNQFVNARLLSKTLQNAVLIPTAAVQRNGTQAFAYVVTGDSVHIHQIMELTTDGNLAAVSGLKSGEVVAVSGFDKLQDGSKVQISRNTPGVSESSSTAANAGSGL